MPHQFKAKNGLILGDIVHELTDVNQFLVADTTGLVKYRTGAEVLSDIGGVPISDIAIPNDQIVFGNATSDGLTSSANLTWSSNNLTISGTATMSRTVDSGLPTLTVRNLSAGTSATSEIHIGNDTSTQTAVFGVGSSLHSAYPDEFFLVAKQGDLTLYTGAAGGPHLTIDGTTGYVSLAEGVGVDKIETVLTNDDTHLPTSGAVSDAIAATGTAGINQNEVAYGNATSDGLTSSATFKYDGTNLDVGHIDSTGHGYFGLALKAEYQLELVGLDAAGVIESQIRMGALGGPNYRAVGTQYNMVSDKLWWLGTTYQSGTFALRVANSADYDNNIARVDASTIGETVWSVNPTTFDFKVLQDFSLATGSSVNEIEDVLTNDDTHLPTSGAVYDAIDAVSTPSIPIGEVVFGNATSDGITSDDGFEWDNTNKFLGINHTPANSLTVSNVSTTTGDLPGGLSSKGTSLVLTNDAVAAPGSRPGFVQIAIRDTAGGLAYDMMSGFTGTLESNVKRIATIGVYAASSTASAPYYMYLDSRTNASWTTPTLMITADNRVAIAGAYNHKPLSTFEVHGNAVIGDGFTITDAPLNGMIVEGAVGFGTDSPDSGRAVHIVGSMRLTAAFYDSTNSAGTNGQILSSTGTGTATTWIDAPTGSADGVLTGVTVNSIDDVDFTITDGTDILGVDFSHTHSGYLTGNETITLTGQVTGSGATSIATTVTVSAITDQTELTTGLASTDEFLVSDAGVIKRMDTSVLQTYMQDNLTFSSGGGGDVSVTGTSANNQIAVWTGTNNIEGTSALTFDDSTLLVKTSSYPVLHVVRDSSANTTTTGFWGTLTFGIEFGKVISEGDGTYMMYTVDDPAMSETNMGRTGYVRGSTNTNYDFVVQNLRSGTLTETLRVTEEGYLGIGSTNPLNQIVAYKDQDSTTRIEINNPNTGTSSGTNLAFYQNTDLRASNYYNNSDKSYKIATYETGSEMFFSTVNVERLRILDTGQVYAKYGFRLDGAFTDSTNSGGTNGQILSSTGTGTATTWIDAPTGTGDVTGTGATNQVAFWTGTTGIDGNANFTWDGNLYVKSATYPVIDIVRDTGGAGGSYYGGAKLERVMSGTAVNENGIAFYFKTENNAGQSTYAGVFGGGLANVADGVEIGELVFSPGYHNIDPQGRQMVLTAMSSTTASLKILGDFQATAKLKDSSGDAGTSGQILSSTATGTNWIDAPTGGSADGVLTGVTINAIDDVDFIITGAANVEGIDFSHTHTWASITSKPTPTYTLSGDVTGAISTLLGNNVTIATTIGALAVHGTMLNTDVISDQTALTTGLASTDELLVSDAGVLKRMDISVIQTYMQDNLSFSSGSSPLSAKGDLYTFSTVDARLQVGTNGYMLYADSNEATGLKWAAAPTGTGDVTGTGVADRVAFWSATKNITYDDNFKYTTANGLDITGKVKITTSAYPVLSLTRQTTATGLYYGAVEFVREVDGNGSPGNGVSFYFKTTNAVGDEAFASMLGGGLATVTDGAEVGEMVFNAAWHDVAPGAARQMVLTATSATTADLELLGGFHLDGFFYDENDSKGTAGQILSSTATGTDWIDAPSGADGVLTGVTINAIDDVDFIITGGTDVLAVDFSHDHTWASITSKPSVTYTLTGDVAGTVTATLGNAVTINPTTIGALKVHGSMLNTDVISTQTDIGTALASTDELLVSDAGVLRKMDVSVIQTYMQNNLTFSSGGGGDVSVTGTSADSQIAVWTGTNNIEGTNELTYDGSTLIIYNAAEDKITLKDTAVGDLATGMINWTDTNDLLLATMGIEYTSNNDFLISANGAIFTLDDDGSIELSPATDKFVKILGTTALFLTSASAELHFDDVAPDGGGIKRITCNDGGGNFNIRSGSYYDSGEKYTSAGGGAAFMTFDTDAGTSSWRIEVAEAGTSAGDAISYANQIFISTTEFGVGTSTPDAAFHFLASGGGTMMVEGTGDVDAKLTFVTNSVNKAVIGYENSDNALKLSHSETGTLIGDDQLIIKEGKVGIGRNDPVELLDVSGNTATQDLIIRTDADVDAVTLQYNSTTDTLDFIFA